jgi:hypothetical protein
MYQLAPVDLKFKQQVETGALPPKDFDHRSHLRLAYIHIAEQGLDNAVVTFSDALLKYLSHHRVDLRKYNARLTQAWLRAVWYFMQRAGSVASGNDFLQRSSVLHDPKIMLTHYSNEHPSDDKAGKLAISAL